MHSPGEGRVQSCLGGPLKAEGEPRGPHSHSSALRQVLNMPKVPTSRTGGGGKARGKEGRGGEKESLALLLLNFA